MLCRILWNSVHKVSRLFGSCSALDNDRFVATDLVYDPMIDHNYFTSALVAMSPVATPVITSRM